MGCIQCNKKIKIEVESYNIIDSPSKMTESDIINFEEINNKYEKNMSHRLTLGLWTNIIDYLSYNEIKEIGKINKTFNRIVKQNEILIKFFKKRNSDSKQSIKNSNIKSNTLKFISFSLLRNSSVISGITSENKINHTIDYS